MAGNAGGGNLNMDAIFLGFGRLTVSQTANNPGGQGQPGGQRPYDFRGRMDHYVHLVPPNPPNPFQQSPPPQIQPLALQQPLPPQQRHAAAAPAPRPAPRRVFPDISEEYQQRWDNVRATNTDFKFTPKYRVTDSVGEYFCPQPKGTGLCLRPTGHKTLNYINGLPACGTCFDERK